MTLYVFQDLEDSCCGLLSNKTAQPSGRQEQTFQRNILPENTGSLFLRNLGTHILDYIMT
jgi:hypothetical protein